MYEINFHTKISSAWFTGLSIVFSSFPVFGHFESTKLSSIQKVLDGKVRNFSPTKISSFTVYMYGEEGWWIRNAAFSDPLQPSHFLFSFNYPEIIYPFKLSSRPIFNIVLCHSLPLFMTSSTSLFTYTGLTDMQKKVHQHSYINDFSLSFPSYFVPTIIPSFTHKTAASCQCKLCKHTIWFFQPSKRRTKKVKCACLFV